MKMYFQKGNDIKKPNALMNTLNILEACEQIMARKNYVKDTNQDFCLLPQN